MALRTKPLTFTQRYGFMDEDHQASKHDEIMLWLDENMGRIVQRIYGNDWNQKKRQQSFEYYKKVYARKSERDLKMPPLPKKPPIKVLSKEWEYAITNKYRDMVGFIDMRVCVEVPHLVLDQFGAGFRWQFIKPITRPIHFEVKSRISSLGEVIRQVRMYQAHVSGPFIIVSPDDRFQKMIRQQKIGFIKYPY